MLYEVSHFIKKHFNFLWDIIEWGNSVLFLCFKKNKIKKIPLLLTKHSDKFLIREATINDSQDLELFFSEQPTETFRFFNPHGFDKKSIQKVIRNKSFLTFVVLDHNAIVGYFFLRCFINGKCFKGRVVDYRQRNKGIAKIMGNVINDVAVSLKLSIYTTISPDNYASLASTKAVNDIKIIKILDNGYYYIECTPKINDL